MAPAGGISGTGIGWAVPVIGNGAEVISEAPAWVRRKAASPAGRRAAELPVDGDGEVPATRGRAVPPAGGCQPRSLGAEGLAGLGHHEDGKVGVDAEAEAIGRRAGPGPLADDREELGPARAGLALKFI